MRIWSISTQIHPKIKQNNKLIIKYLPPPMDLYKSFILDVQMGHIIG